MKPVAIMFLREGKVHVEITDEALGVTEETVYVWKTAEDGEWLRVGTSQGRLDKRLLRYAKHINQSFQGKEKPTPMWEALEWKNAIEKHGKIVAVAHQAPLVKTIAGDIRPYLNIERILIKNNKPRLNRSNR